MAMIVEGSLEKLCEDDILTKSKANPKGKGKGKGKGKDVGNDKRNGKEASLE